MKTSLKTIYKKAIVQFWIILSIGSYSTLQAEVDRNAIRQTVEMFCQGLKEKDKNLVSSVIDANVSIRHYSPKEVKAKVDSLILNKISPHDYLRVITGLNINKFINGENGTSWKLISAIPNIEQIFKDKTTGAGGVTDYYFVKVKVVFDTVMAGSDLGAVRTEKSAEIDLLSDGKSYKVFGFIL